MVIEKSYFHSEKSGFNYILVIPLDTMDRSCPCLLDTWLHSGIEVSARVYLYSLLVSGFVCVFLVCFSLIAFHCTEQHVICNCMQDDL